MSSAAITSRFGAAVRNLRFRLGMSQEDLAERADLHRTYIAGIERGARNVTLKSVAKLADALKVSTGELLTSAAESPISGRDWPGGSIVNILLVAESPEAAELTLETFRMMNVENQIDICSDGASALKHLFGPHPSHSPRTTLPQLILLDLDLPKVRGLDVLRRIKQDRRTKNIPVLVLTPSTEKKQLVESLKLGADGYLVKPVDFHNFSQVTPQLQMRWALFEPAKGVR